MWDMADYVTDNNVSERISKLLFRYLMEGQRYI